jgi:translation initiation factor 2 subunit 1
MWYHKTGFPEEDDIVLCTVKTVQYHSVFVTMDHYDNKTGMIHISEVSPGRIRNIREFVVEGKKVWCKVLKINHEKGHIDLSLRRVNESQKRIMNDKIKQEQRAEKIIEMLSHERKEDKDKTYTLIATPILKEFEYVHDAFNDAVDDKLDLATLGYPKELSQALLRLIKEKITPKFYEIGGVISIKTYDEQGIDVVKNALSQAQEVSDNIDIKYLGGGTYSIKMEMVDVKEAERNLKDALDKCRAAVEAKKGVFEFKKKEA